MKQQVLSVQHSRCNHADMKSAVEIRKRVRNKLGQRVELETLYEHSLTADFDPLKLVITTVLVPFVHHLSTRRRL